MANTIMTIQATETPTKPQFEVDFGCDITDELTPEQMRAHARRNYKVDIQNGKLGLRAIDDIAKMQEVLRTRWPNATVKPFVTRKKEPRELTNEELIDAFAKKFPGMSKAQIKQFIEDNTPKYDESIEVDTIE